MGLAAVNDRIERAVAEKLLPRLFDRAVLLHAKRQWRHCNCDWCTMKRRLHTAMQHAPYLLSRDGKTAWRDKRRNVTRYALTDEIKRIHREAVRANNAPAGN